MRIYPILLACTLFFLSCQKTLDYEVDFPGEQLVIIGTVSPDAAEVYITKSIAPYGDYQLIEDLMITDAQVFLYSDTLLGALEHRGGGRYTNPETMRLNAGTKYRLEVVHDQLGTAISRLVRIPEPILDLTADLNFTGERWPSNQPEARLSFSLQDRPGVNYYIYDIRPDLPDVYPLRSAFPAGERNFEFCGIYYDYMLDTCFDGESFALAFYFGLDGQIHLPSREVLEFNRLRFRLASISPEYYQFLYDKRPLETEAGIVDPRPTYTNIEGGLGVFMGLNEEIRWLRF